MEIDEGDDEGRPVKSRTETWMVPGIGDGALK